MGGTARRIYLDNIPLEEAVQRFASALGAWGPMPAESVPAVESVGRVTAEAVFAANCSPHYHSAAMDGIAVTASQTFGASPGRPLRLKLGETAFVVDTGNPMPPGCDAVIKIEDVIIAGSEAEIHSAAVPWQHVRPIGEDIVATELILPQGHRIRPVDVGAMLAAGVTEVAVRCKPRVAIIPTGSELVEPGGELRSGSVVEFNSKVLGLTAVEWGAEWVRCRPVKDDREAISEALLDALERADIVVLNAGSSAGSRDYTREAVERFGSVIVHGVAIRPGKPVLLAIVRGKPVIGIPGYPVSAVLTFDLMVKPLVARSLGEWNQKPPTIKANITRRLASDPGSEEFVRVKVGKIGSDYVAAPLARGAGVITSLVRADGVVRIPRLSQGYEKGSKVDVELFSALSEAAIENTLLATGSHDIALDLLGNILHRNYPEFSLSSAHVGSMAGITAIRDNEAHLAGCHLLDESSGEYNVPFIVRLIPKGEALLITLVHRQQGLIVRKGNPDRIESLADIARPGIRFVNRQRGAGTRILLDLELKKLGISPDDVSGYEREEYTHMGVAAAVMGGSADVGLGIYAAAKALDLDFIPIGWERYDLLVRTRTFESPAFSRLMEVIRSDDFAAAVGGLGGYDTTHTGELVEIWGGSQ